MAGNIVKEGPGAPRHPGDVPYYVGVIDFHLFGTYAVNPYSPSTLPWLQWRLAVQEEAYNALRIQRRYLKRDGIDG